MRHSYDEKMPITAVKTLHIQTIPLTGKRAQGIQHRRLKNAPISALQLGPIDRILPKYSLTLVLISILIHMIHTTIMEPTETIHFDDCPLEIINFNGYNWAEFSNDMQIALSFNRLIHHIKTDPECPELSTEPQNPGTEETSYSFQLYEKRREEYHAGRRRAAALLLASMTSYICRLYFPLNDEEDWNEYFKNPRKLWDEMKGVAKKMVRDLGPVFWAGELICITKGPGSTVGDSVIVVGEGRIWLRTILLRPGRSTHGL